MQPPPGSCSLWLRLCLCRHSVKLSCSAAGLTWGRAVSYPADHPLRSFIVQRTRVFKCFSSAEEKLCKLPENLKWPVKHEEEPALPPHGTVFWWAGVSLQWELSVVHLFVLCEYLCANSQHIWTTAVFNLILPLYDITHDLILDTWFWFIQEEVEIHVPSLDIKKY